VTATPPGRPPTVRLASVVFVAALITRTESEFRSVT
jgi:hypothetical protein